MVHHVVNYYNPSAYRELHTDVDGRGDAQLFTTVLLTLSSDFGRWYILSEVQNQFQRYRGPDYSARARD
eukprot:2615499-Prymnesium_polylepis.1